jgi:hypothetical protein
MQQVKPGEVEVATIHDVDGAGFWHQNVEHIDIAQLAVGDMDEARDVAAQVEQRVHLHRRLGGAKQCPWKQRQAQVDGGGVQRVSGVRQLDTKALVDVKLARLRDQALGEFGLDAPMPRLVGIGQRRAFDRMSQTHVVELGRVRRQASFDIAQTLAISQLREGHHSKLLGTGKRLHVALATMSLDDTGETRPRQKIHQLGEQRLAGVHGRLRVRYSRNPPGTRFCRSNRHHPSSPEIPHQLWLSAIPPFV